MAGTKAADPGDARRQDRLADVLVMRVAGLELLGDGVPAGN
jgi:hypothetical protein